MDLADDCLGRFEKNEKIYSILIAISIDWKVFFEARKLSRGESIYSLSKNWEYAAFVQHENSAKS